MFTVKDDGNTTFNTSGVNSFNINLASTTGNQNLANIINTGGGGSVISALRVRNVGVGNTINNTLLVEASGGVSQNNAINITSGDVLANLNTQFFGGA